MSQARRAGRTWPLAMEAAKDTKGMAKTPKLGRAHKTMRHEARDDATHENN